jgi:hypothetical protein
MAIIATIVSVLAFILSLLSWHMSRNKRSSTEILNSVIKGMNKAVDIIKAGPLLRVNWIAAGRLLSYCNVLSESITDEQDKQALKIEVMILRERAYPLFEMESARYYGNMLNNLNDAADMAHRSTSNIPEQDILALWNSIKYPADVNAHYSSTQFTSEQIQQLPSQLREYVKHLHRVFLQT